MSTFASKRTAVAMLVAGLAVAAVLYAGGAGAAGPNIYNVTSLISDGPEVTASSNDAALVNGWGLSAGPATPWWVTNNHSNTSTLYNGAGAKQALVVTVPGGPTGTVFNGDATAFPIGAGGKSGGSRFLFANEGGQILGWSPTVVANAAVVGIDRSAQGASYKGMTIMNGRLYATDFHNGRVDVFDKAWAPVAAPFKDAKIPAGWAPFGIQALNGSIFVTYAQQDKAKADEVAGGGLGYVDEFTPDGALVARVASQGKKNAPPNAPWGLAMAPASFGVFGGELLVGNFGNGRISAYTKLSSGKWVYKGQLRVADGAPVAVDGLWAIAFGNGAAAGPTDSLYFAAGPTDETHGLFGVIRLGG